MPSRRELLVGLAAGSTLCAGCLGSEEIIARCSSQGGANDSQHLRRVVPIRGETQVALGIVVSPEVTGNDDYQLIEIRDRDDRLVGSIPLDSNRGMSSLDTEQYPILGSDDGELYAFPLGRPPVHGVYSVSLINVSGEPTATARKRFNCYTEDGSLP